MENLRIKCTGLNDYGYGKFLIGSKVHELKNLLPGEEVIISKNKYSFDLVKHLSFSKIRENNVCKYFNKCGSCHISHMKYENQIEFKKNYVKKCFNEYKIPFKLDDIISADKKNEYRNKMQVAYIQNNKDIIYGFYEEDSHKIIPIDNCLVQTKKQNEICKAIKDIMIKLRIEPYNEDKRTGLIRFALIRESIKTNEVLVTIVTNSNIFVKKNDFVKMLIERCPYVTTVIQNINTRKTSIILGDEERVLYGKGYINDSLCNLNFKISSKTFYQINSYQTDKLYGLVKKYLDLKGKETVLDCYCGVGTIGMSMASCAKYVLGVDNNKQSIKNAISNAKENNIKNIEFICDDATMFIKNNNYKFDCVIMDPPRTGSTKVFLETIKKMKPKKIVYVSCGADTLARDLKDLIDMYNIEKMGICDMFVGTYHVETVICLSRKTTK